METEPVEPETTDEETVEVGRVVTDEQHKRYWHFVRTGVRIGTGIFTQQAALAAIIGIGSTRMMREYPVGTVAASIMFGLTAYSLVGLAQKRRIGIKKHTIKKKEKCEKRSKKAIIIENAIAVGVGALTAWSLFHNMPNFIAGAIAGFGTKFVIMAGRKIYNNIKNGTEITEEAEETEEERTRTL